MGWGLKAVSQPLKVISHCKLDSVVYAGVYAGVGVASLPMIGCVAFTVFPTNTMR